MILGLGLGLVQEQNSRIEKKRLNYSNLSGCNNLLLALHPPPLLEVKVHVYSD